MPVKTETAATPKSLALTATAVIDVDAAASGDGATALPRFRMVAYTGGPMRVAGWRHPVIVDLAGLAIPSQSRPIRFGHDPLAGVGHTDSILIEQGQLVAAGVVSRDTPAAREVVVSSKNGFPWQASVGASVEEFEFIREGQNVTVNGQQHSGPVNVVRRSSLGEISFVDLGADGATTASVTAINQSHEGVESMGVTTTPASGTDDSGQQQTSTPAVTSQQAAPAAGNAVPVTAAAGSTAPVTTFPDTVSQIRAQAASELDRIAKVRRVCDGKHIEIEAKAIRDGWDEQRTELEILRGSRPTTPAIHIADNSINQQVLEAACLMTGSASDLESQFDAKTLEAADRRFRGGIGLQELLLEAAWANGYTGRNFRDSRGALRAAFGRTIEAGWSTIDLGGILSNVANKFLLEGFFSVERTWRNICAVRNVSDFKTVTSYRLIGKDQYEIVAPGGELKNGTLGEEKYSNKADTYGLKLAIDRRDFINDDLGAITSVPRKLGRGSGLKINDIFWSVFLANSDFFKVANKNFVSGADTALSIDGLTKGEVAFMDQVDSDGKPIGVMPSLILVPTALSAVGSQLFKSLELRDTTPNAKFPVSNPHQGKFRVEVSRYLSNAQYTGNSSKAWYMLADASDLPVIEVAFLNGQESPTIETSEADFNVLGVQMRGYHDFGVALQDPRGGVKAKGEV
jgi:hypothetical protein